MQIVARKGTPFKKGSKSTASKLTPFPKTKPEEMRDYKNSKLRVSWERSENPSASNNSNKIDSPFAGYHTPRHDSNINNSNISGKIGGGGSFSRRFSYGIK